jgi:hypothetical protein
MIVKLQCSWRFVSLSLVSLSLKFMDKVGEIMVTNQSPQLQELFSITLKEKVAYEIKWLSLFKAFLTSMRVVKNANALRLDMKNFIN